MPDLSMPDLTGAPQLSADQARLARIESQLTSDDRLARLEALSAAIQATLSERRVAETEAAEAIQRKLEETAKAAADGLKSALDSANVIELERVGRVNDRIGSVEKAAEIALATADKAVALTREDGIRTEAKQNEFRGALEDQASRVELSMMPRKEFEQAHGSLQSEVSQTRNEARTEITNLREEFAVLRQTVAVGPPEIRQLERGQAVTSATGYERNRLEKADAETLGRWIAVSGVLIAIIIAIATHWP